LKGRQTRGSGLCKKKKTLSKMSAFTAPHGVSGRANPSALNPLGKDKAGLKESAFRCRGDQSTCKKNSYKPSEREKT